MREHLSAQKYQQGLSAQKYRCAKISTFTVLIENQESNYLYRKFIH